MPTSGAPALHHVALACRDPEATHRFYGELLGFELVHTEIQKHRGGVVRHFFYDLGDGSSIAFFELRGAGEPAALKTAISTDLGLPAWVNHLALRVDPERRAAIEARLAAAGIEPAMTLDHGWCDSSYFMDPNGILVELCEDRPGLPRDPEEAERLLRADPETL
jgi:catechol 2,3-dioxygenase-like lactoylglutathione lyase family enzyme